MEDAHCHCGVGHSSIICLADISDKISQTAFMSARFLRFLLFFAQQNIQHEDFIT